MSKMSLFSLFISFVCMNCKSHDLKEDMSFLQKILRKKGFTLANFRESMRGDTIGVAGNRIVFDLQHSHFTFHDCDLQIISHMKETFVSISFDQRELFESGLFDIHSTENFILDILIGFCSQHACQVGIAAFEDSISSLDFERFTPGVFNAFKKEYIPEFLLPVDSWLERDNVLIFTDQQLLDTGWEETEMATSLLKTVDKT